MPPDQPARTSRSQTRLNEGRDVLRRRRPDSGRGRGGRLAALAVLAGSTLLAAAGTASANRAQSTIFDPGTAFVGSGYGEARREQTLDRIGALGADVVRVVVPWRWFAPDPDLPHPPVGFDASDPADYPRQQFEVLDRVVRRADQLGLGVLLTPSGPIPDWASASGLSDLAYPSPTEFGHFVTALGKRYSGLCGPPTCTGPDPPRRVSFWAVWNEPNLVLFLQPQFAGGRRVGGRIYRGLFLSAQRALLASGHGSDRLLIGETAPSRGSVSTPPIEFLRDVLCLDRAFRRNGKCAPIRASGWAQHPYLPAGVAPWQRAPRDVISIGSLGRLERALRLAARAGATRGRLPIYITELGIQSYPKPPDAGGRSELRQAEYLGVSEYLLWRERSVRSYAQYLMEDDGGNPREHLNFNTGLRFADGAPKLSYSSFAMTLVARRRPRGRVEVWGHVRPARAPVEVKVSYRDPDGTHGLLRIAETDRSGYFRLIVRSHRGRKWRAASTLPDGRELEGPAVRAFRFQPLRLGTAYYAPG
jgi:hypothetical protein